MGSVDNGILLVVLARLLIQVGDIRIENLGSKGRGGVLLRCRPLEGGTGRINFNSMRYWSGAVP